MCEDKTSTTLFERSEVQAYITYLQDIINRMAGNSSNCKNWLIAIIVAFLAVDASKDDILTNIWICYIPTVLFMILDCYYLGLERHFRCIQKNFVKSVKENKSFESELYNFEGDDKIIGNICCAITSFSIYPFYGIITVGITLVYI